MLRKLSSRLGLTSNPFANGGMISLAIKIGSAGITFAMLALLSRVLPSDEYGIFAFNFSLVSFLGIFATLGFHRSVLRSISELQVRGQCGQLVRCLRLATEFVVAASLVATGAVVVAALSMDQLDPSLLIAAALILPIAYSEFVAAALRALGFLSWALAPKDVVWRGGGALLAAILLVTNREGDLDGIFAFLAGWLALLIAIQTSVMFRSALTLATSAKGVGVSVAPFTRRSLISLSVPMWLASILFNAAQHVDVVVVGAFLPLATVGLYFAVARTANLLSFVVYAIDMVASPQMAEAYNAGDPVALQRILRHCAKLIIVPMVGGFAFVVAFAPQILSIFGSEFATGKWLLIAMSACFLIAAACGPVESFMQMSGLERPYLYFTAGTYIGGLVVMVALMPFVGIWGAVAGHFISVAVRNLISVMYARRKIGIDPSVLNLLRQSATLEGDR